MNENKLYLGDIYARFDGTGALCFHRSSDDKEICWVNFMGVSSLKDFIENRIDNPNGGTSRTT